MRSERTDKKEKQRKKYLTLCKEWEGETLVIKNLILRKTDFYVLNSILCTETAYYFRLRAHLQT